MSSFPTSTVSHLKLQPQIPTPIDGAGFVAFYEIVRLASEALSFNHYSSFLNVLFCGPKSGSKANWPSLLKAFIKEQHNKPDVSCDHFAFSGLKAYDQLREATELFVGAQAVMIEDCCGCDRDLDVSDELAKRRMEELENKAQKDASEADELSRLRARFYNKPTSTTPNPFQFGPCSEAEVRQRFRTSDFTLDQLKALARKLSVKPGSIECQRDGTSSQSSGASESITTSSSGASDAGDALEGVLTFMQQLLENHEGIPLKDCTLGSGNCIGVLVNKLRCPPLLELIWSYWMEQGMLVQGLNALTLRFQNRRPIGRDPLARCDISPLRPMNNIFWGYVQREYDRLTVVRRAYEYDHHYGLRLDGNAVPRLSPADSRSQFIEAFHRLLADANRYYRTSMDTTMNADGFPMLNSLRELHLVLAEGAHNQFGDLPTTARTEMLVQQWILARPEVRDFLGGRPGVPYPERWMPHLESMRQMMGWNDTTIRHYRDLATFGERLLLSIRYLPWSTINDAEVAKRWAEYWRAEVQAYLHSYRAVTGVDLGIDDVRLTQSGAHLIQPSDLIRRRRASIRQVVGA